MTDWIRTEELLDRLPAPRRSTAALVKTEFLGKKEIPPEIPRRRALAVAAFAQAHSRGINNPRRIYDLVESTAAVVEAQLLVVRPGGPPRLVPADGFEPTSAVVIDLDQLAELIEDGCAIPG
jgi:hypothetical protein